METAMGSGEGASRAQSEGSAMVQSMTGGVQMRAAKKQTAQCARSCEVGAFFFVLSVE